MTEVLIVLTIALMVVVALLLIAINREFDAEREVFKIFNEHLDDELKKQDKAIQELNEILRLWK